MNQAIELSPRNPLVTRCWADEAFKKRLLADPMATLKAEGIQPPSNFTIRVFENTPKVLNIVLPARPAQEMSDQQLEAVAGGGVWQDIQKFFDDIFMKQVTTEPFQAVSGRSFHP